METTLPPIGATASAPSRAVEPAPATGDASFAHALDAARETKALGRSAPPGAVEPQRTPLSKDQVRQALRDAYVARHGGEPPPAMLDVMAAHVSHETAGGTKIYNFNFGGIKGVSPSGHTAHLRTHEYIRGRRVDLRDGFRAYESAAAGASDYLEKIEGTYGAAVPHAERGDVDGFVHALKRQGYFTAPVGLYARSVQNHLTGDFSAGPGQMHVDLRRAQLGAGARYAYGDELLGESLEGPVLGPPSTVAVARVLDAARGAVVRLGRPVEEEA